MYPDRGDMEHRWGHRHQINRGVQLETRAGVISRGRVTDVSISGAFVVTPLPIPLFSYVHVQFTGTLDGKRTRMAVEGQVVRKGDGGFGVEWCEFAAEAIRALILAPAHKLTKPSAPHSEWEPEPSHAESQQRRPHARAHNGR
jgi:hypothetical protein